MKEVEYMLISWDSDVTDRTSDPCGLIVRSLETGDVALFRAGNMKARASKAALACLKDLALLAPHIADSAGLRGSLADRLQRLIPDRGTSLRLSKRGRDSVDGRLEQAGAWASGLVGAAVRLECVAASPRSLPHGTA
ncbi:MAG: hypothetical protein MH204_00520 [Fimbriimonadaceae bacterium]|nr:hypothetical protein [Fimbriimonadaceae bacterium]